MDSANTATSDFILCPNCSTQVDSQLLIPAGESKVCPNCRDEFLQRMKEGISVFQSDDYEQIRQEHIKHEASIRSIGILYLLGAVLTFFAGVAAVLGAAGAGGEGASFVLGMAVFYIVFGVFLFAVGRSLRKLKKWAKVPSIILACLGLLGFPLGTLINGYILYLLLSKKGTMVFSAEYQDVIEATPHVKYRTSPLAWALLVLLVIGLFVIIGMAVNSGY